MGKASGRCKNWLHDMTEENTLVRHDGVRRCKACCQAAELRRSPESVAKRYIAQLEKRRGDPEFNRKVRLAKYCITPEQLDALGDECMVCGVKDGTPEAGRWNRLHLDHDHETGRPRGLLCNRHNLMLGHANDSADELLAGAMYLLGVNAGA